MSDARRTYPSDLSDAEWAVLAPLLPPAAPCGRPRKWPERLIADAVFYLLRSGCAWRILPREFPPWPTVYARFRRWRVSGTLRRAHDTLRARVRVAEGRAPEASAAVIDSQSAKTTGVGGPARGYDGAKRLKGRKRHVLVDTTGLVLLACVHGADLHDRDGARRLVAGAAPHELPRLELVWADQGYTGSFARWLEDVRGWRLHVVRHPERQLWRYGLEDKPAYAFRVLPRRWVVERTFAWLGQSRRLSKDYEHLPAVSEAMIYGAMSRLMLRRLTHAASAATA
jgi:putative transposase